MVKKEGRKKERRDTTSIPINKDDVAMFNEVRARESGRIKAIIPQTDFIRFLLCLYDETHDTAILDKSQRKAKQRINTHNDNKM